MLSFFQVGISGRSQLLFLFVFVTRYMDLFTRFISLYNTLLKMFYIVASLDMVYLIFIKLRITYDKSYDTFQIQYLIIPSAILAYFINHQNEFIEVN